MNKQLERDLQCSIQSLKALQLANVLTYYQKICEAVCEKKITSKYIKNLEKGMSYEC